MFAAEKSAGKRMDSKRQVLAQWAAAALLMWLAGCGNSKTAAIVGNPTGVAGMPTESTPAATNTYVGTQSPGAWTISLNDTNSSYSYQPTTFPSAAVTGSFTGSHGFIDLGHANGTSQGYGLEVPGRMIMLRPGDSTSPLVIGVPQTSCYSIPYRLRFDYIAMEAETDSGPNNPSLSGASGSFVVNTNTDGTAWQFQDMAGTAPVGPAGFSGACATGNGQAVANLSGEGLFNQFNYGSSGVGGQNLNLTTTFAMGPSGVFVIDQSDPNAPNTIKGSSVAGVAEPSSPLSASTIAMGSYLGFLTESAVNTGGSSNVISRFTTPVSFAPTSPTSSSLIGGVFPNDDLTQTPGSNLTLTLGKQDSKINGLYSSATITAPDPTQACATALSNSPSLKITVGTDTNGFPICTFPAVAVVGNPDGKYSIFVDMYDYTVSYTPIGGNKDIGTTAQIYLYQQ